MKFRWPWILVPVSIGSIVGLVLRFTSLYDPLIYLEGYLSLLIVGFSFLVSLGLAFFYIKNQQDQILVKTAQQEFSEDRRRFLQRLDHELKNPLTAVLAGLANLSLIEDREAGQTTLESVGAQTNRYPQPAGELRQRAALENRPLGFNEGDLSGPIEEAFHPT